MSTPKLYVVVREDLSPAQQAVQAAHAAIDFQHEHRSDAESWHSASNTLALLSARDEQMLEEIAASLHRANVPFTAFREPDIGDRLTAIAAGPSASKVMRKLPLALSKE